MKILGMGLPEMVMTLIVYLIPIIIIVYLLSWLYQIKKNTASIAEELQKQTALLEKMSEESKIK